MVKSSGSSGKPPLGPQQSLPLSSGGQGPLLANGFGGSGWARQEAKLPPRPEQMEVRYKNKSKFKEKYKKEAYSITFISQI